jgi:two-component system response regulator NreC
MRILMLWCAYYNVPTVTTRIKVFIADDHALLREGLRAALERHPVMDVVGEAGDGREAVKRIEETSPDVVLMDIAMPGLNGLEATRQIRKALPRVKILVLSMYDDQEYIYDLLRAGASGYMLKGSSVAELAAAIEAVARGGIFLNPSVAGRVVEGYVSRGDESRSDLGGEATLTAREREVLQLVAEGHGTAQIAGKLGISPKTVETHRSHIATKLDIRDVPGLVKYAIRKGLIRI